MPYIFRFEIAIQEKGGEETRDDLKEIINETAIRRRKKEFR